jgi:hypothetical protein
VSDIDKIMLCDIGENAFCWWVVSNNVDPNAEAALCLNFLQCLKIEFISSTAVIINIKKRVHYILK